MTPDEFRVKCLQHEADAYRKAIIRLAVDASTGPRKTMDKLYVAKVAGKAIDDGNTWSRRSRGENI